MTDVPSSHTASDADRLDDEEEVLARRRKAADETRRDEYGDPEQHRLDDLDDRARQDEEAELTEAEMEGGGGSFPG